MRKILFLLPVIFQFAFAQDAEVTNIQAAQRTDGSQVIDITYDLMPDAVFEYFEVTVEVSLDGGNTYQAMTNVSGDLGIGVTAGTEKTLIWNYGLQFIRTYSDQIKIRINATSTAIIIVDTLDVPFEMVPVLAGDFTFGEGDTVKTIDYDYEIMKFEVTDYDYVLYLLDAMENEDITVTYGGIYGSYPGDAYYPADDNYQYCNFGQSKISWNGEIFELEEGYINHPVTGVTWFGAWAFATYYGMELPDEYEWEKAARGNTGYDYPWGDEISIYNANYGLNYLEFGFPNTTPIGFFNGQTYSYIPGILNTRDVTFTFIIDGFGATDNYFSLMQEEIVLYEDIFMMEICDGCPGWPTITYSLYTGEYSIYLGETYGDGQFTVNISYADTEESIASFTIFATGSAYGEWFEFTVDPTEVVNRDDITLIDSPSPYGLYDMAGNINEWIDLSDDDNSLVKGGSFTSIGEILKSWFNEEQNQLISSKRTGFRCMRIIQDAQRNIDNKKLLKRIKYHSKKNRK